MLQKKKYQSFLLLKENNIRLKRQFGGRTNEFSIEQIGIMQIQMHMGRYLQGLECVYLGFTTINLRPTNHRSVRAQSAAEPLLGVKIKAIRRDAH